MKAKRILTLLLSMLLILNVVQPCIASAADGWTYVENTMYEPVSLYVRSSSLTSGKTYLLGLADETSILSLSSDAVPTRTTVTTTAKGQTMYYTDENGETLYTADNAYIVDTTGSTYAYNELQWNNGVLYNPTLKQYLAYSSSTSAKMNSNAGSYTWSFASSKLKINNRYLRFSASSGNAVVLGTTNSSNTVYPYEKVTAYRKVPSGVGEYYKYNGRTQFDIDKNSTFDESTVLNAVSVLHSQTSGGAVDKTLTINDPEITLTWNTSVNTAVVGSYTAAVYAEGVEIGIITVNVIDDGPLITETISDPSTSSIEDFFEGSSEDDGMVKADKSVKYGDDDYGVFSSYSSDQFSVTLSALGQAYPIRTAETIQRNKHPDVVFVLDASGSMREYTVAGSETVCRGEGTAMALNSAIKTLYEEDPETRIGIVTYNYGYTELGVYLPLDKYTLPEGETDYILWGQRKYATGGTAASGSATGAYDVRTVSTSKTLTVASISSTPINSERIKRPPASELTKIATVNGVTYYAGLYLGSKNKVLYIYRSDQDMYLAAIWDAGESYIDENIKITRSTNLESAKITYTTNSYTASNNVELQTESVPYLISTNFLINSSGEVVRPSSYKYLSAQGTYTQAGLQAAENMFNQHAGEDLSGRVPAIVLISDGIPTVSHSNVNNPVLYTLQGTTDGCGYQTESTNATSALLCTHGLRVIRTGIKVKKNVENLYHNTSSGNKDVTFPALFYSIGPGVDYTFGKLVLDPNNENIEQALTETVASTDDEAGVGIPHNLAQSILNTVGRENAEDYVDWSYAGDMSYSELTEAFSKVVRLIVDIPRPISKLESGDDITDQNAYIYFTDTIGEGMEIEDLSEDMAIVYDEHIYTANSVVRGTDVTDENGVTLRTDIVRFNYTVIESSTGVTHNLGNAIVYVDNYTYLDGSKKTVVRWLIPSDLLPVVYPEISFEDIEYNLIDPIRLVYKVGLTEESLRQGGTYYTNSVEEPATCRFNPTEANPYYYDNTENEDGVVISSEFNYDGESAAKTANPTGTAAYSSDVEPQSDNSVKVTLGNNGKISLITAKIDITKVWQDSNNEYGLRPDSITVQIYRNGDAYRDPVVLYGADCIISVDENGDDIWRYVIDGLPYNENFVYTVEEVGNTDYSVEISSDENGTIITNTLKHGSISYELYLVDDEGNPIDGNGEDVTFENRTVMSSIDKVEAYIHSTMIIDLDELEAILPDGYYIYNPETSYTEIFEGTGSSLNTAFVVDNEKGTTKVFYPTTASIGSDGTVSGLGDFSEIHVAFAIAKIGILPDTVVIDYGIPVKIHVTVNDYPCNVTGVITGISDSIAADTVLNTGNYTFSVMTGKTAANGETLSLKHGTAHIENGYIVYQPTDMLMDKEEVFYYELTTKEGDIFYTTVTIIPAANIYYEDSFITFNDNGDYKWETAGSTYTDVFQAEDRPGTFTFSEYDANNVYGRDQAYDDSSTTYSLGSAKYTEVDNASIGNEPTAEFTFCGTGFDFFSCTNSDTGTVLVDVMKDGVAVQKKIVNTYYGYTYGRVYLDENGEITADESGEAMYLAPEITPDVHMVDGKLCWTTPTYFEDDGITLTSEDTGKPAYASGWVVTEGDNGLYQVPVIRIRNLDYGTYDVKITPKYSKMFDVKYLEGFDSNSYRIYVDAVRIYDPAGVTPKENSTVGKAYIEDNEYIPQYIEIRNQMIDAETFYDSTKMLSSDEFTAGVVFIDGITQLNNENIDDISVSNGYLKSGPNNELYLAKGQAIAFHLISDRAIAPESLQLGMKTVAGGTTKLFCSNAGKDDGTFVTVSGGSEQYRKLSSFVVWDDEALEQGVYKTKYPIIIANSTDTVASLTTLKWTYSSPDDGGDLLIMSVSPSTPHMAVKVLRSAFADEVESSSINLDDITVLWKSSKIKEGKTAVLRVTTPMDITSVTVDGIEITECQPTGDGNKIWTYSLIVEQAGKYKYEVVLTDSDGNTSEAIMTQTLTVKSAEEWNEEDDSFKDKLIHRLAEIIREFLKKFLGWWK